VCCSYSLEPLPKRIYPSDLPVAQTPDKTQDRNAAAGLREAVALNATQDSIWFGSRYIFCLIEPTLTNQPEVKSDNFQCCNLQVALSHVIEYLSTRILYFIIERVRKSTVFSLAAMY